MTEVNLLSSGAPSTAQQRWDSIDWNAAQKSVHRLQMRIAKAYREKKYGKMKSLQWLLTHSHHAKLLAVKRVTQNRGANTPGVDNVVWKTPKQKLQATMTLRRHDYKTMPLRRLYIPKKQPGKLRPLSIPTMKCRAMQALYLLALEPISEMMADENAYGFRPKRAAADAIAQCFSALSHHGSARYILEGDIESCFDKISHSWLLNNVPMDKEILEKWLRAGYINNEGSHPIIAGTPQGGIISPCLLVITLSGLERAVKAAAINKRRDKIHLSIYADDFVVTGATREILEEKVKPAIDSFLTERGLSLSREKTCITNIEEGFNFLGMHLRRYKSGKLLIKPAKESIKSILAEVRRTIKLHANSTAETLIRLLNSKLRGWTNYYRHVCSKKAFQYVGSKIFEYLWRWAKRRHRGKNALWIRRKYFRIKGNRQWMFYAKVKQKDGTYSMLDLFQPSLVKILRHIKIRREATPYDFQFVRYFIQRKSYKTRPPKGAVGVEW